MIITILFLCLIFDHQLSPVENGGRSVLQLVQARNP
jgi:hypothetical protein